jgi:hypothetical protein
MTDSPVKLAMFALCVALISSVAVSACALFYLRRFRIERPAIGVFNRRDIGILFVLLATIPVFYLQLPRWLLTSFLALTFLASLSIGFRPLLRPGRLWLAIGLLIGGNIWIGNNMLGSVAGWQLYWAENSIIVLLGAMSVANLYVQGGMRLQHVAWFALVLAVYDVIFTGFVPVTDALVENFLGFPLDPSMGFRLGLDNAAIGIGDLLVYALFITAAFKAYGRSAARVAMVLIAVFGAALPTLIPLLVNFVDARADILVPAQACFGPAAYLGYRWMRRKYGPERTVREFLASTDVVAPSVAVSAPPAAAAEPETVGTRLPAARAVAAEPANEPATADARPTA